MNGNKKRLLFGIDTNVFIYHYQNDPQFVSKTDVLFTSLIEAKAQAVTSIITLIELLSFPAPKKEIAKIQEAFLSTPNLEIFSVDQVIGVKAAEIRRIYKFRLPDAVQLATAVYAKADVFVTNDKRLRSFKEIKIKLL